MKTGPPDGDTTFKRALRAAAALALVGLASAAVLFEGRPLMVVLAGVLVALALRGSSRWVSARTRIPYLGALAVLVVFVLASLGLGLYFLGTGVAQQADAFARQVPAAWQSLLGALRSRPTLAHLLPPGDRSLVPSASGASLLSGAGGALEVLSALVVAFFLGLYGAASPEAYAHVVLQLVPPRHRARARAILADLGRSLTRWLAGRAVAMAVVGGVVAAGLYAMKIPLAGMLGVVAGWLTFVEYIGAFLSVVPALLLALSRGPGFVAGVAVLFTVAHVLEGYVLTPLLVRTTVRIPPGYTLSAQLLLGSIFGVVGLTFATPVTIVVTLLVKHLYVERRTSGRVTTLRERAPTGA